MKKQISKADKLAILEDKYNTIPEDSYKKTQMWAHIQNFKRKYLPKVFHTGGTYVKEK